jgi:TDG/mug DNA glycosylase family protein
MAGDHARDAGATESRAIGRRAGRAAGAPARPRPSPAELLAARGKTVPDVIVPDLAVLFVGINPGLYTAAIGHHFGRPGNRFWPALLAGRFTDHLLSPYDERDLLTLGCGITNVVAHATASADDLTRAELVEGGRRLAAKARRYRPRMLAFLGIGAYRTAFGRPRAVLGPQPESIGPARVWIMPNPSGLNAHYQAPELARMFTALREAVAER